MSVAWRGTRILGWMLLVPRALGAQEPPDTAIPLPQIDVISSIVPGARSGLSSGVPAATHVIDSDVAGATLPRLLPDVLTRLPGVSTYDDLGSAYKPTLLLRGFAASPVVGLPQGISVFVDGVPVNEPDAGQVNFDLLPLEHVARIEVLRGSASLLGPHTIGGAINLITRRGSGPLSGSLTVEAGSHGQRGVHARSDGSSGGWTYYAGGGYEQEDGWRQRTHAERAQLFMSAGRAGAERGIRLNGFAATSNAQTAGSLPRSVYVERPDSNLTGGDFEDIRQAGITAAAYHPLGAGTGVARVFVRAHDAERFNVNQITDPDVRSFSENRTLGAIVDWRIEAPSSVADISVRLGAGGGLHSTSVRIFAERIDEGLTTHVDAPIRDGALFANADLTRGRWSIAGSARLDVARVPFRNRLNPARDTTSTFVHLAPRVGVTYRPVQQMALYASFGRTFRAPALIELACADPEEPCPLPFALGDDPPLDPVIATTWEAGAHAQVGSVTFGVAAYTAGVQDDIFLMPYEEEDEPEQSTIDGYFANIERTRRRGVEVDAAWESQAGHGLAGSYAFTQAQFGVGDIELFSIREEGGGENEIEKGDRLPLVPEHTFAIDGHVALPAGLTLGAGVRYVGERRLRGDEANVEPTLDASTIADARATWRISRWTLVLRIANLFDTAYATYGSFNFNQGAGGALERFLTPGEPRTLHVALQREFGG